MSLVSITSNLTHYPSGQGVWCLQPEIPSVGRLRQQGCFECLTTWKDKVTVRMETESNQAHAVPLHSAVLLLAGCPVRRVSNDRGPVSQAFCLALGLDGNQVP